MAKSKGGDQVAAIVRELAPDVGFPRLRTYTTGLGITFTLRPVPAMVIRRLNNDTYGKPQPPKVSVTMPNGQTIEELNPNDPDYVAALSEWKQGQSEKAIAYIWTLGICAEVPELDKERLLEFMPGATPTDLKFAWILEQLSNESEIGALTKVIVSQTVPTEDGVREAEATFPGND